MRDKRSALGALVIGLLAAAAVLAVVVPLGPLLGAGLFGAVVVLVGIVIFRFHPEVDLWALFREQGINPWLGVVGFLLLALAFGLLRVSLLR
jgi:hypothetical protein